MTLDAGMSTLPCSPSGTTVLAPRPPTRHWQNAHLTLQRKMTIDDSHVAWRLQTPDNRTLMNAPDT